MNTLRFMSWLLKLLRYDINSSSLFESFFQIKGICPDLFKAEGLVLQDSQTFRGDTWLQQQFNCNCILVSEVKIKCACEIAYVPTKLSLDQYTHTLLVPSSYLIITQQETFCQAKEVAGSSLSLNKITQGTRVQELDNFMTISCLDY